MAQPAHRLRVLGIPLVGFIGLAAILRFTATPPQPPNPFGSSRELLARARRTPSWHFKGWREIEGKKLAWEIWGESSPYFCYEKLGECVRVTRGSHCDILIPPQNGAPAFLVKGQAAPRTKPLTMVLSWTKSTKDPKTGLPLGFAINMPTVKTTSGLVATPGLHAELQAEYSVALPEAVRGPIDGSGAVLLEPKLTIDGAVDHIDSEGHVQLSLSVTPRISSRVYPIPFIASVSADSLSDKREASYTPYFPSDQNTTPGIKSVSDKSKNVFRRNKTLLPGEPLPKQLIVSFSSTLSWDYKTTELLNEPLSPIKELKGKKILIVPIVATPLTLENISGAPYKSYFTYLSALDHQYDSIIIGDTSKENQIKKIKEQISQINRIEELEPPEIRKRSPGHWASERARLESQLPK